MASSRDRAEHLAQWMSTIAQTGDTVADPARHTMRPNLAAAGPAGARANTATATERALEVLEQLARHHAEGIHGQIEVGDTIGEGGMGVVRLGTQVALGRTVAIKTLRPGHSPAAAMELLHEAWVTGALEHPNVMPVYDIGVDTGGQPIIVLKRIEGEQWADLMHDAARVQDLFGATDLLDWNLEILHQVCNAVRFAHQRGIIHRDLKPENVMIGEFGEVYVLDWGIAVSLRDDADGRMPLARAATDMAGTPCYMAPEMLGGGADLLGEHSDVYLLGSILYEILAGHPPHQGDAAAQLIAAIVESAPQPVAGAPAALVRIYERAMDADPAGRFERAEQFQLAIAGYRQHRGSEQLAADAQRRLDELRAAFDGATDPERTAVYKLFGACRFGFHAALDIWAQNDRARAGVRAAVTAMAEYELRSGDASAADALLAELADPPAGLRARVDGALEVQRRERGELEALRRDSSSLIGARTRWFLSLALGLVWTATPLLSVARGEGPLGRGYGEVMFATGVVMTIGLIAFLWGRESLLKTAMNRRITATVFTIFSCQLILLGGCWIAGVPLVHGQQMMLFLWTVTAWTATLTVDWRMFPMLIGYSLAFLTATHWPDTRFAAMAAANGCLTITLAVIWYPSRAQYPTLFKRASRSPAVAVDRDRDP